MNRARMYMRAFCALLFRPFCSMSRARARAHDARISRKSFSYYWKLRAESYMRQPLFPVAGARILSNGRNYFRAILQDAFGTVGSRRAAGNQIKRAFSIKALFVRAGLRHRSDITPEYRRNFLQMPARWTNEIKGVINDRVRQVGNVNMSRSTQSADGKAKREIKLNETIGRNAVERSQI